MNLKGKNILITGGSSGLGKAAAKELIDRGANVAITARNKEYLKNTADELNCLGINADVSKEEDVLRTYKTFLDKFGSLDVLINNAGLGRGWTTIDEVALEDLEYVFRINVFGAALMAREAAKLFKEQNHGNIINIGSTAATKGFERGTVYAGSKWAIKGMTQCWQAELRKHNVRVMLLNPSYVPTAFGSEDKVQKEEEENKLTASEIAHGIVTMLEMENRGFIPEFSVWATNPF
ncbi:MAG: SDR family NAD(P)-dependent oxidoreductase [Chitinophagales bacterium]|nr:SDR family NAD(P)-dependent oxidoreductase [Chitinophagales bacterium]